jgi:urease beta subunit
MVIGLATAAFGPDFQESGSNPGQVGSHYFATEASLGLGFFAGSAETTYTWDLFHI